MSTAVLTANDADQLTDLVRAGLGTDWTVQVHDQWVGARPDDAELPPQGWKLHVSATAANAPEVVRRILPVLSAARCVFKVARNAAVVRELTGPHADRVQAGKVVTIYPTDDHMLRDVATRLVDATDGLTGPRILTDRPVRPGSLVHYRYGAFTGIARFAGDGRITAALRAPDGTLVADRREAGFTPPPWATDPLASTPRRTAGSGLLAERYRIVGAIRHAARGGVFRALDTVTDAPVVIKQARSHIAEYEAGEDTRTRLRREAEILREVTDIPGLPRLVQLFEQEGDVFLVETDLGGTSLRSWVSGADPTSADAGRTGVVLETLTGLARTVAAFHARGLVLRDLTPNNVLVDPTGCYLGLVDLETVLHLGDDPARGRGATPGYAAPELNDNVTTAVDIYSLAATIAFAFTTEHPGVEPWLPTLIDWLGVGGRRLRLPSDLVATVGRMADSDPGRRPMADEVVRSLQAAAAVVPASHRAVSAAMMRTHTGLVGGELDTVIARLTDLVLDQVDGTDPTSTVASSSVGRTTAPTNVHHGSGGVLLALSQYLGTRCHEDLVGSRGPADTEDQHQVRRGRVRDTLDELVRWTMRRAPELPDGGPVGLNFGGGGTAYAVARAADVLDRPEALEWAVDHAVSLELPSRAPDLTHGTAGLGIALVELWDRTGDPRLADRIDQIVDLLAETAVRDDRGIGWALGSPPERALGFAHGLAGITQFLLGASNRFGRSSTLALVDEAVQTLVDTAVVVDGCARWPVDLSDRHATPTWWCHGTAGVVVPLLTAATNPSSSSTTVRSDRRPGIPDTLLRAGGRALVVDRWQHGISYCHGLSGSADALLDLDAALPGEGWRDRAAELMAMVWSRRQESADGLALGDRGVGSVVDFGVGHAGVLSVLLRLRDGGPRALGSVSEVSR